MSWGQDPHDRDRDFDPWSTERGRGVPAQRPQYDADPWGDDATSQPLQPLNLGDVLDGMFRVAGRHWRAFALALGIVILPLALLFGLVFAQLAVSPLNDIAIDPGTTGGELPSQLVPILGTLGLTLLVAVLVTPLIFGTAAQVAADGYRTNAVDVLGSVRSAAGRYLALLGSGVLLTLILFAATLSLPLVIAVLSATTGGSGILNDIGFLGTLVLIVVAFTRLALVVPVIVVERVGPIAGLQRSNTLVKGATLRVLGRLIVIFIIIVIIGIVLIIPLSLISTPLGSWGAGIASVAGQLISNLITTTLWGTALVLIYFDRRVRSEGYDLSELADELGDPRDTGW